MFAHEVRAGCLIHFRSQTSFRRVPHAACRLRFVDCDFRRRWYKQLRLSQLNGRSCMLQLASDLLQITWTKSASSVKTYEDWDEAPTK